MTLLTLIIQCQHTAQISNVDWKAPDQYIQNLLQMKFRLTHSIYNI